MLTKLRAILLMEADFNHSNKEIFGFRMLENARKYELIPDEIFSECNKPANVRTPGKVIFIDIVRQTRLLSGLSLVDAANCYVTTDTRHDALPISMSSDNSSKTRTLETLGR